MTSIGGSSSAAGYPSFSVQGAGKINPARGPQNAERQAAFEQDLAKAGLNADVSTDELLADIQSSIKSAISDPKNSNQDFLQVIQDAVQATLEKNGVNVEDLTSLLETQSYDLAWIGGYGSPLFGNGTFGPDTENEDAAPDSILKRIESGQFDLAQIGANEKSESDEIERSKSENRSRRPPEDLASQFKRLISDLISSLPSGTTLDVQA